MTIHIIATDPAGDPAIAAFTDHCNAWREFGLAAAADSERGDPTRYQKVGDALNDTQAAFLDEEATTLRGIALKLAYMIERADEIAWTPADYAVVLRDLCRLARVTPLVTLTCRRRRREREPCRS